MEGESVRASRPQLPGQRRWVKVRACEWYHQQSIEEKHRGVGEGCWKLRRQMDLALVLNHSKGQHLGVPAGEELLPERLSSMAALGSSNSPQPLPDTFR